MKNKFCLILGMVLLSSMMAFAQTSCANPTVVQPSGEPTNFDFVAPTSSNYYQFDVRPNRSYSVTVRQNYDLVNTDLTAGGGGGVFLYTDAACTVAVPGTNDTSGSEPPLPANAFRSGFVTPNSVANQSYRIKVTNGNGAAGRYIEVVVSETTLFSPLYTTFSGFNTFYRVFNTTGQTITGTMTAFSAAGSVIGTPAPVTIPAYSSTQTIYTGPPAAGNTAMNIPANNAGPVVFVHNGPAGGVVIDGFSGSFSNGVQTIPIKFVSVRE